MQSTKEEFIGEYVKIGQKTTYRKMLEKLKRNKLIAIASFFITFLTITYLVLLSNFFMLLRK